MEHKRVRGQSETITQEIRETALKVAQLLSESRTTFNGVDQVFSIAKRYLIVSTAEKP